MNNSLIHEVSLSIKPLNWPFLAHLAPFVERNDRFPKSFICFS